mmetsp:Transcript_53755/g.143861  ORF Transcript_53755/g.143861 Transcript_53755/m.143861 type:complete len:242 (-) Transcript_53755:1527-2252(-)
MARNPNKMKPLKTKTTYSNIAIVIPGAASLMSFMLSKFRDHKAPDRTESVQLLQFSMEELQMQLDRNTSEPNTGRTRASNTNIMGTDLPNMALNFRTSKMIRKNDTSLKDTTKNSTASTISNCPLTYTGNTRDLNSEPRVHSLLLSWYCKATKRASIVMSRKPAAEAKYQKLWCPACTRCFPSEYTMYVAIYRIIGQRRMSRTFAEVDEVSLKGLMKAVGYTSPLGMSSKRNTQLTYVTEL